MKFVVGGRREEPCLFKAQLGGRRCWEVLLGGGGGRRRREAGGGSAFVRLSCKVNGRGAAAAGPSCPGKPPELPQSPTFCSQTRRRDAEAAAESKVPVLFLSAPFSLVHDVISQQDHL